MGVRTLILARDLRADLLLSCLLSLSLSPVSLCVSQLWSSPFVSQLWSSPFVSLFSSSLLEEAVPLAPTEDLALSTTRDAEPSPQPLFLALIPVSPFPTCRATPSRPCRERLEMLSGTVI